MPYVVDGYNLIHRDERLSDVIDEQGARSARDGLLAILQSFAEAADREVTVIFDGGRNTDPLLPRRERRGAVEVRYSEPGRTADQLIEEMIESYRTPADLYVVSDDKSVARAIESHGAHGLAVDDFLEKIRSIFRARRRAGRARSEKPTDVPSADIEYWLRAMGLDDGDESGGKGGGRPR